MNSATISERDSELVRLVSETLQDPELSTARKLLLEDEILDIIRKAHEDVHGAAGREAHEALAREHEDVDRLLFAVMVNPDLHTDLRMRLLHEIPQALHPSRLDRELHR